MPGPFAITAVTNSVGLDANRRGTASFTVFNASGRPVRGRAQLVSEDPAAAAWLTLDGEPERDLPIADTEQYTVQIAVPPDAPAGSYPFRLDMVGVENPDEDYTAGPTVTFVVPEPAPKKPFPWWILLVIGGVLVVCCLGVLVLGGGAWVATQGQPVSPTPTLTSSPTPTLTPSPTPTLTPSPTSAPPTPTATATSRPQVHVVYIYSTDSATATGYKKLLEENGFVVDLVAQKTILSTNLGSYACILIGPDTGNLTSWSTNPWGDAASKLANYVRASSRPVLGLGYGGSLLFQAIGLRINFGNSAINSTGDTDVYVVDARHPVWRSPARISIPSNGVVTLYSSNSSYVAMHYPSPVTGVTAIGRQSKDKMYYQIIGQTDKFLLWGFNDGPSEMTKTGQQVLINALNSILP